MRNAGRDRAHGTWIGEVAQRHCLRRETETMVSKKKITHAAGHAAKKTARVATKDVSARAATHTAKRVAKTVAKKS